MSEDTSRWTIEAMPEAEQRMAMEAARLAQKSVAEWLASAIRMASGVETVDAFYETTVGRYTVRTFAQGRWETEVVDAITAEALQPGLRGILPGMGGKIAQFSATYANEDEATDGHSRVEAAVRKWIAEQSR